MFCFPLSLRLQVILKEREERKQRRLLEEMGLLPEQEGQPAATDAADAVEEEEEEDQSPSSITDATGENEHRQGPHTLGWKGHATLFNLCLTP